MEIDIFSSDCAEALFCFVSQTDIFEDFCSKSFEFDYSIAEYVYRFRKTEFKHWYSENYS